MYTELLEANVNQNIYRHNSYIKASFGAIFSYFLELVSVGPRTFKKYGSGPRKGKQHIRRTKD